MTTDLRQLCWPAPRLGEALAELARKSGLLRPDSEFPTADNPSLGQDKQEIISWIRSVALRVGIEVEPVEAKYNEVQQLLLQAGPALVPLTSEGHPSFLALLHGRRKSLIVLGPDLRVRKVPLDLIYEAVSQGIEESAGMSVQSLLELETMRRLTEFERTRVRRALLGDQIGSTSITCIWLLRLSPGTPFLTQILQFGLFKPIGGLLGVYSAQYLLVTLAWWILGSSVLAGHFDWGWLMAWALALLTILPLEALATWYQGLFAIGSGGLLKRRLLYGALQLEPDEVRTQGAGQMLGRVIESEAVESLALNAGFIGALAVIELVIAAVVMALGAGGWFQILLFICWIVMSLWLGWIAYRRRRQWTKARISMTQDLVEKMVGHRTRLAQERKGRWHTGEDQALEHYLDTSVAMDRAEVSINALLPQGWMILGVLGLAPAFLSGGSSQAALAVSLGGMLLAAGALQKLSISFSNLAGAAIAWTGVSPLFHAAAKPEVAAHPEFASAPILSPDGNRQTMLETRNITFRHQNRASAVLNCVNMSIVDGDRILLKGRSGGGKSTLASLLAGLRSPDSGIVLLRGLDPDTLGLEAWRKRIAMAPQFNENHILTETLAFNLLMGRKWPPDAEDLEEAATVCRELGLDELTGRMPAGLFQIVGENAWQPSHGERSRIFIARALLQHAELLILDESFGALDPETLLLALRCISRRANAVLLIAHP
jgi:ATP-binding cassette, subfamily B, bacterial